MDLHYASTFAAAGAVGLLAGLTLQGSDPYAGGVAGFRAAAGQGFGQSATQILGRFLNRLPTVTIRAGPPAARVGDLGLPRTAARAAPGKDAQMTKSKWRWLIAGLVVAVAAGTWSTRRAQACLFGTCDSIIIGNQITQIARMVTQIGKRVEQLSSLEGGLDTTTELVTSNDVGMGNIGRRREVTDAEWLIGRHGIGLSTSTSLGGVGAFLQRIPGVTDEAGWLGVLAAPGLGDPSSTTVLLAGRPATETSAAEPSAFRSWAAPAGTAGSGPGSDAAREAIDILGDGRVRPRSATSALMV